MTDNDQDTSETDDGNDEDKKMELPHWKVVVLVLLAMWGGCAVLALACWWWPLDDAAKFGDAFGAINALFSGLALAGIIYAIILQRNELQLQRKELELTRKELTKSADAQKKTQEALFLAAFLNASSTLMNGHADYLPLEGDSTFQLSRALHQRAMTSAAAILEDLSIRGEEYLSPLHFAKSVAKQVREIGAMLTQAIDVVKDWKDADRIKVCVSEAHQRVKTHYDSLIGAGFGSEQHFLRSDLETALNYMLQPPEPEVKTDPSGHVAPAKPEKNHADVLQWATSVASLVKNIKVSPLH